VLGRSGRARTFIVVETLFFSMWWEDPFTTDAQRAQFRKLLQSKQVEFVNGGWVRLTHRPLLPKCLPQAHP
jgi:hypothetical protein